MMAKKVILRLKNPASPETMSYLYKRIKAGLDENNVVIVNSDIEVFIVEAGDEIRIENEEGCDDT